MVTLSSSAKAALNSMMCSHWMLDISLTCAEKQPQSSQHRFDGWHHCLTPASPRFKTARPPESEACLPPQEASQLQASVEGSLRN
eukprot:3029373-Rhodomonas_salina.1